MKSKVYTRTGDKGETSLVSGNRVSKASQRIDLYGEVDELNSFMGLLISYMTESTAYEEDVALLKVIQSSLFDLGSNLACELENRKKYKLPQVNGHVIGKLENRMDDLDSKLPKIKNFILPGGHKAASAAHICRTVCRRVERNLVHFEADFEQSPENALTLLNRLSDYFFVLSRHINLQESCEEIEWIPSK